MNKTLKIIALFSYTFQAFASCDLTQFRWGCSIYPEVHQKKKDSNLIYCGSTRLYVSNEQFKIISHYQRAGVMMQLKVNDVFFDGPCIAATYGVSNSSNYKF
jgi:hypothetical protein